MIKSVLLFFVSVFYLGLLFFVIRDYDKRLSVLNERAYKLSTQNKKEVIRYKTIIRPVDLKIRRVGNCKITVR